ncbi:hypothetical protein Tcan_16500 [Toxocara canis]|uniref:Uncharacterized protein n=1 Tax=Toxocara canis TaxID=6265 RepID=A0A0B2W4M0_TOXCA|nr:hypothetical protein Tcan_16500 [Toxocara canis]
MPSSAPFALSNESNVPHTSGTANRRNNDEFNDRIIMTAAQPSDNTEYVLLDEPTHIPHYSIKNAARSSLPSSEHPISEAHRKQSPPCDFNSQRKSGKFSNFEAWNTSAVHETEISSASFQPIFESEKTTSLSRFAEKRVNSPNTAVPFESENCNSFAVNDEHLRRSESVLSDNDSIYLCSKHDDESKSEMFALEGDLWERHSLDILSQFSTLELQPILKERTSVSPESLRRGDSRRKQRDVPLLACKLLQSECEYTEPKCTVYEKTISKPESDNFLSDNVNGTPEHSLMEESDHVKSSTSLIDRATSPQSHGSDSLINLDKDESSIFHSSAYPILNIPSSATIDIGSEIPLVNAEADSEIDLNHAGIPTYGAIRSRSPLFTDNADFDNESRNVATRKSEILFLESPLTNIRNNGKPEFEACMRVAETKLVSEGKDKLVMKESVPVASIDDGFEADDEPTTSVRPTDLSAAPSKSILHVHSKPTRLGKNKSVSFPSREPEVVVSEHRLIITGVESDSDTV